MRPPVAALSSVSAYNDGRCQQRARMVRAGCGNSIAMWHATACAAVYKECCARTLPSSCCSASKVRPRCSTSSGAQHLTATRLACSAGSSPARSSSPGRPPYAAAAAAATPFAVVGANVMASRAQSRCRSSYIAAVCLITVILW
jgi:hypothetical protein